MKFLLANNLFSNVLQRVTLFKLNIAARIASVCDIAQLSGALRTPYAPGDRLTLQLDKAGEQAGQAVGYLADGTMVVVRDAEARIGQSAEVVVQKTVQKDSGRILFAELSI